jgi:hypothetical protein
MSGIVQAVFSDQDLARLLDWYATFEDEGFNTPSDDFLAERLRNYTAATACPTGKCNVPRA